MTTKTLAQIAKENYRLAWNDAVALIDKLPAAKLAKAVKDFEAATMHWYTKLEPWDPSSTDSYHEMESRISPPAWYKDIFEGKPSAKHSLIRILDSPARPKREQKFENLLLPKQQLSNVREVRLRYFPVTATLLKQWKGKGIWQQWESLHICDADLKPATIKALVQVEMPKMKRLNLGQNRFGSDAAAELSKVSLWSALQEINISNNRLDDQAAKALAGVAWLKQLKGINLEFNQFSDDGFAPLAASMPSLSWLSIGGAALNGSTIGASPGVWIKALPSLETLQMSYKSGITNKGLASLLAAAPASLVNLYINKNPLGDAAAIALAESGRAFSSLDISYTNIGSAGTEALLKSPQIQQSRSLMLNAAGITEKTAKLLTENFPKLERLSWCGDESADEKAEKLLKTKLKNKIPHLNQ